MYIKSWAEIINDFKFRYNRLLSLLEIDKKRIIEIEKLKTGVEIEKEWEAIQK